MTRSLDPTGLLECLYSTSAQYYINGSMVRDEKRYLLWSLMERWACFIFHGLVDHLFWVILSNQTFHGHQYGVSFFLCG